MIDPTRTNLVQASLRTEDGDVAVIARPATPTHLFFARGSLPPSSYEIDYVRLLIR